MPEAPQGVAQRVMEETRDCYQRARAGTYLPEQEQVGNQLLGMRILMDELSAEAQRVLNEMEVNRRVASKNGHKESMGLIREDIMLLTEFCQRLGLDLEEEAN